MMHCGQEARWSLLSDLPLTRPAICPEAQLLTPDERRERMRNLEQRIADIRARLPKHSPPTSMLVEIDEMEDELARLRQEQQTPAS